MWQPLSPASQLLQLNSGAFQAGGQFERNRGICAPSSKVHTHLFLSGAIAGLVSVRTQQWLHGCSLRPGPA